MSFTKTTEEKNPKPQKNTEHESQGNKNAMVCMSLNFGYLCSGSSLPPELKQSEGHSTLLREGTAPSDSCSCWSSGKLHFPMKTENSSDSKVAVPTPCNLRSPIYSWLMQLCDSFAIAFRGFFFALTSSVKILARSSTRISSFWRRSKKSQYFLLALSLPWRCM